MMKDKVLLFLGIFACLSFINAQAEEELNSFLFIDVGKTDYDDFYDINIFRFGMQREFGGWLGNETIPLSGYFESSLSYWKGVENKVYGMAFSPVFVAQLCNRCKRYIPYVEGGIGVSWISSKEIDNRSMSSLFQFEDRLGFGVRTDKLNLYIRYLHYSNANIVRPNQGIDILAAGISFRF